MASEQGSWSATATSSVIAAADEFRGSIFIQLTSGNPVSLGIGKTAVFGEGIKLISIGDQVVIEGPLATEAIHAVCDTGGTAGGGYQEG